MLDAINTVNDAAAGLGTAAAGLARPKRGSELSPLGRRASQCASRPPLKFLGLALRASQSAKSAKSSHSFPTLPCMFYGIVPMFPSCFRYSKFGKHIEDVMCEDHLGELRVATRDPSQNPISFFIGCKIIA
uniref:Polyprotein n=1 Tax=Solanum tuberosum TaxID=4113 RepID=M1C4E9_SOLTU